MFISQTYLTSEVDYSKKKPNDIHKAKEENMLIELANDSKFKRINDMKNSREILQRHVN